jgi:hypothetical protein
MKPNFFLLLSMVVFNLVGGDALAQKDSTVVVPKWGIDKSYTGLSYVESAVFGVNITYTTKRHAVAFGPHVVYQSLFQGQSDWERYGAAVSYSYFPIRSNRLFSPFVYYDLNYNYAKATRLDVVKAEDGVTKHTVSREATSHSLAHHFGIGTRCNFYQGFFLHLSVGAGPSTFGQSVFLRSLQSAYSDEQEVKEHPFSNYETAFMFRFGIAYQIGTDQLKKGNKCCD